MAWKTRKFRHTKGEVRSYYAGLKAGMRKSRSRSRRTTKKGWY